MYNMFVQLSLTAGSCEEAVSCPSQLAHVRKQSVAFGVKRLVLVIPGTPVSELTLSNNLFNLISAALNKINKHK